MPITKKQAEAIEALLVCKSFDAVHRKTGVARSTIRRWLNNPEFSTILKNARNRQFQQAIRGYQGLAGRAVVAIQKLLNDPDPRVRLKACQVVLTDCFDCDLALEVFELRDQTRASESTASELEADESEHTQNTSSS